MKTDYFKQYRLLIETAIIVVLVICVKLFVEQFSLEVINMSPLFTSVIAGGIFIISIILSGIISDYKESEKLPAEIASAVENIYEDGLYIKEEHKKFDLKYLQNTLQHILQQFRKDLSRKESRTALTCVADLSTSFLEMEKLGAPANYIVRLKQEQSLIRKSLLRIYHIQRIKFLPSAYILAETIVFLIIGLLIFTKIEPFFDGMIMVAFISYLFIFLIKLLRTVDQPFRVDEYTMDDVSLFILRETNERVSKR